jgi:hypothetical protein
MVTVERTTNEFKRHLDYVRKEGDRGKGGFKSKKVGQRSVKWEEDRLLGRCSFLFPNVQS